MWSLLLRMALLLAAFALTPLPILWVGQMPPISMTYLALLHFLFNLVGALVLLVVTLACWLGAFGAFEDASW